MTTKTALKTVKNLERINSIFTNLKKCKTDKIIKTILGFGELKFYDNFNGLTITLNCHSDLLIYANQNRKFHLTNYQTHKHKKINNEILPVLKCMLHEIQSNIQIKINQINILIEKQQKNEKAKNTRTIAK